MGVAYPGIGIESWRFVTFVTLTNVQMWDDVENLGLKGHRLITLDVIMR